MSLGRPEAESAAAGPVTGPGGPGVPDAEPVAPAEPGPPPAVPGLVMLVTTEDAPVCSDGTCL
ncbi:hypothetical protein ACN28C_20150 [Plantactinospora sp. WMMC1484]|uniref:hypothetical protein n=1 Tax=Plantactinospora sp. WMMC1484 TaxID=3404122 RepID=UPI003BF566EA